MFNPKQISTACLLAFLWVSLCSTCAAQDQTRFVLKLDNTLISSFRSFRSLRSNVPPEFKGKISVVELQFPETKSNPPVEMDLDLTLDGDSSSIQLTEETIQKLKAQPIRVPVAADKNQFSQIVLVYAPQVVPTATPPIAQAATATTAPETIAPVQDAGTFFVRIGADNAMSGTMNEFESFEIKTKFGTAMIPADQIAGIKFHTDKEDSAVVVLSNGDSITGVPAIDTLNLTTDWGLADIDLSSVNSLTTISSAKFSQETTDWGSRWVLKTGATFTAGRLPIAK